MARKIRSFPSVPEEGPIVSQRFNMQPKHIFSLIGAVIGVILLIILGNTFIGHNNSQNWQIIQSPGGDVSVRDNAGYYNQGFSSIWTYPRANQFEWGPVRVTFNDGGTADMKGTFRVRMPTDDQHRMLMHREFQADESLKNVERALESHLINAIKSTGPIMSGSEHQSARKGEFYNIVYAQLEDGLYQTRKIQRELLDQFDQTGKAITVFATEIVLSEDGKPRIQEKSPLLQYGFEIAQFSIEETEYDAKTQELFAAKKESLLQAEKSKAQREQEVQERLMIVERGLKEKTEIEAQANKEKAKLTIEGATRVSVAEQAAFQALEMKKQQTTEAEARRDVAALQLETERLQAEAIRVKASAEEERISKAGAITEKEQVLATIDKETKIGVARELSKIQTPGFMISGSGNGSSSTLEQLLNVFMLRQMGVFDPAILQK